MIRLTVTEIQIKPPSHIPFAFHSTRTTELDVETPSLLSRVSNHPTQAQLKPNSSPTQPNPYQTMPQHIRIIIAFCQTREQE